MTSPASARPFSIHRATSTDRELAQAALAEVSRRHVDLAALDAYLADSSCYLLLASEGERPLGVLAGQAIRRAHESRPQFLLYEIDVKETAREKGVGRALIERYREEARASGASEVWVLTNESNRAAMKLYERCGMARPNPDDVMWVLPLG